MTFCVSLCPWFEVILIGLNFANLPQFHKYTEKSINWPSDDLLHLSRASFDVQWGVYHYEWFSVYRCYDRGNLAQSPQLAAIPKYTKTGITQPADNLYIWVRLHLMWNVEFNTLDNSQCIDAHDLGNLGLISLTCPNFTETQKQV